MRVLVTGATGFIGRHLLPRLVAEHELVGLVRRLPAAPVAGVRYILQELTDPLDKAALPSAVDAIIHQAALIDTECVTNDAAPFLANVVATWRLLGYAQQAGARCFVHASTGGVYGCGNHPFVEDEPFNPFDLY